MADNQITPFQLTDQFTMDNFNQRINETNTALQKKADASSLADKADIDLSNVTDDVMKAKVESSGFYSGIQLVKLWENASPTSAFATNTVTVNMSGYEFFIAKFCITTAHPEEDVFSTIVSKCCDHSIEVVTGPWSDKTSQRRRTFATRNNQFILHDAYCGDTLDNTQIIPLAFYGVKGVTA